MSHISTIIVGQGLAGTALAWALHMRGQRIMLVDRGDVHSASRIAAGLVTPITGKRLAKSWRLDEFDAHAAAFYAKVETYLGHSVYERLPIIRLFQNDEERSLIESKQAEFSDLIEPISAVDSFWFDDSRGGFTMPTAARLDVLAYLDQSRNYFISTGEYRELAINYDSRVSLTDNGVSLSDNRLSVSDNRVSLNDIEADRVILCQGIDMTRNRWFKKIAMDPAKGEVLTVRIPNLQLNRIVNGGVWLMPLGNELFRVGSTYHRRVIDNIPSAEGRDEIVEKLRQFLRQPFEIVDHQAAIRPISSARVPIVGLHSKYPQLGIFNGLGSKGTLQAPYFAEQFADFLLGQGTIDNAVSLASHQKLRPQRKRIVEVAQDEVRAVLKPGDIAIDATVGNGHDTRFLASIAGIVHGFDIQPSALDQVAKTVPETVTLHCRSHAEMDRIGLEPGSVAAIMFNLGYLPGSNKAVTTQVDSTLAAIDSALSLLQPDGIMTMLAYRGHPGGLAEYDAVRQRLHECSRLVREIESNPGSAVAPVLFVLRQRVPT